jgi:chorismate dehydratase
MEPVYACVSYLNALPFVEGLRRLPPSGRPRLLLDPPYRCAERLRRGEAEAALIPSIELPRTPGAVLAGGFVIAARREVRSVVLLAERPLGSVRSVAVDVNSRTSVVLLKLLMPRRFGARPEVIPMEPDRDAMLRRCDAALLIGDAALRARREGLHVMDLAAAWHDLTGLPFVFAVWAAAGEGAAGRAASVLEAALRLGESHLEEAAARATEATGLPEDEIVDYLSRNVHFRMGPAERESLERFHALAREEGLDG